LVITSISVTSRPEGTLTAPSPARPRRRGRQQGAGGKGQGKAGPEHHGHSGMLSCFFQGFASFLPRRAAKARATRRRVECGMITSSMKPFSAATKGLAKRSS
jgi:hypothetical protein